jgi:Domain of unknown function (DUF6602)
MKPSLLWSENLDRLRDSLIAQFKRIRAGSSHATIKGTSLEMVLRRTLREYVPRYFAIGSGQTANCERRTSPQLDVMLYDQNVFPHLAVNEDSSVVVCCESLFATVECKMQWDGGKVVEHFRKFVEVESVRHPSFSAPSDVAAYFVVIFDPLDLDKPNLSSMEDQDRAMGIYTVEGNRSWHSPQGEKQFALREGNGFALLLKDILFDCMAKGQKDVGDFSKAFEAVKKYIE